MGWLPEGMSNGLDRVYHALMGHLPEVGVAVSGLITSANGKLKEPTPSIRSFSSATAPLPSRLLRMRKTLRAALAQQSYDLVASHFALYTFPVLDALRDLPLIVHFHGPWALESRVEGQHAWTVRAKALVEHHVYHRARRIIVLSEAFRDVLIESYGIAEEGIRIVPGGVEVGRYRTGLTRAEARRRLGWAQDRPIVLSIRRLVRRVGLEGLIDSMEHVRAQVPDVLLLIGGTGPIANELLTRIRAAHLERNVRLLGYIAEEDLPCAYRAADVSVVPTVALEGFGLVAVESLAAGTPVLVSPVGGLQEIVRDLAEELILPGTDPKQMGLYLKEVLEGHIPLPSDADCQAYARAYFDWTVIAAHVRRVYEEVAA
jgi:glycosyltransferase involved in cell wall biosynthesis